MHTTHTCPCTCTCIYRNVHIQINLLHDVPARDITEDPIIVYRSPHIILLGKKYRYTHMCTRINNLMHLFIYVHVIYDHLIKAKGIQLQQLHAQRSGYQSHDHLFTCRL